MRWDQVEEGDVLLSETGTLTWLVVEKADRELTVRDLEDLEEHHVTRSRHEVTTSFTVLRGGKVLRAGDPRSAHRTWK